MSLVVDWVGIASCREYQEEKNKKQKRSDD